VAISEEERNVGLMSETMPNIDADNRTLLVPSDEVSKIPTATAQVKHTTSLGDVACK
jgi:hypothetical protein